MRNRPFVLPVQKSDVTTDSHEPGNLKNKFSGRILFRNNLYNLETGNLKVLETTENNWFLEELIRYTLANNDPNLLPSLKHIAENPRFGESIRQHASEAVEIFEEQAVKEKNKTKFSSLKTGEDKTTSARKMLGGVRFPQTTDILRLLREKSIESKRLALFLIGKFNMTDMIQEVCQCLTVQGIETDAFAVLLSFGSSAGNDLNRFFFVSSGNMNLSKIVLRIYAASCPKNNISFLVERLWSNSRKLKEIAADALIKCGYLAEGEDREHLVGVIFDTFGLLAKITSEKICLLEKNNLLLFREMDKEYNRWKDYLLKLLIMTYGNAVSVPARKNLFVKEDNESGSIPELSEIIYGNQTETKQTGVPEPSAEKKRFRKLQHFFPGDVPQYKELLEDIVNSDYNILSIWSKASAIRNIAEIEDEELSESVVALLFSPEKLLREEAARLIARSGKELYKATSERIPDQVRKELDRVVSGELEGKELLYEKVRFLASCLKVIKEDELIFLAEKMIYASDKKSEPEMVTRGALVWTFRFGTDIPEISIIGEGKEIKREIGENLTSGCSCYILPLDVVEEYSFQYQESSYPVLKYIDDNEE